MSVPAPHFFVSYSREDTNEQRNVARELRERGIQVWVDIENLVPGSPTWEREIERSIRAAAGVIVLLTPDSNNSEWVRRELSFAEQNRKKIFPVLISGNEDASIPLRLSSHQHVDARRNFNRSMDELARALNDHLGVTAVHKTLGQQDKKSIKFPSAGELKKFTLPAALILIGLLCLGGLTFFGSLLFDNFPSESTLTPGIRPGATETPGGVNLIEPAGKIVFTCQIQGDEVCIVNADGSNWTRLTNSSSANYYASLAPDGGSLVFINNGSGKTEIHNLELATGIIKPLTELKKELGSPEISPDNESIIFTYRSGNNSQVWIMGRDGSDPHEFYKSPGKDAHDPTWSPDGSQILFAMGRGDSNKLYIIDLTETDPQLVNDTVDTRGRSDWSVGNLITFDMGGRFLHDVHVMDVDGTNLHQVSNGNNSQGASFSPDGNWIAFTRYTDVANQNEASCEIFIMRVDGTDIRQLTDNTYCDYQPRWGK